MFAQVYLITELLTGGELLDAVLQRGHYTEDEARVAFVQLIKGIEYLHSRWGSGGCRADAPVARRAQHYLMHLLMLMLDAAW